MHFCSRGSSGSRCRMHETEEHAAERLCHAAPKQSDVSAAEQTDALPPTAASSLSVRVLATHEHHPHVAVLSVHGEIDLATAPILREVLRAGPRAPDRSGRRGSVRCPVHGLDRGARTHRSAPAPRAPEPPACDRVPRRDGLVLEDRREAVAQYRRCREIDFPVDTQHRHVRMMLVGREDTYRQAAGRRRW